MISDVIFKIVDIFIKGFVVFFIGSLYILDIMTCFCCWREKKYLGAIVTLTVLILFTLMVVAIILKYFGL